MTYGSGQLSGRPIYATAMATQHRYVLNNWDRSTINLPFGYGGRVIGDPIHVPADADEAQLETIRVQVQKAMEAVTQRAQDLANRKNGGVRG